MRRSENLMREREDDMVVANGDVHQPLVGNAITVTQEPGKLGLKSRGIRHRNCGTLYLASLQLFT
jgi:hypothetical protein